MNSSSVFLRLARHAACLMVLLLPSASAWAGTVCTGSPVNSQEDFEPSTGLGLFDVALCDDDELVVTLKVAFSFEDGEPHLAPGFHQDEYEWGLEEQRLFKDRFKDAVESVWSGQHTFVETRDDGKAPRRVSVRVVVDDTYDRDEAQWHITARHYPEDTDVSLPGFVCENGTHSFAGTCHTTTGTNRQGTALLSSPHWRDEFVRNVDLPPTDIGFLHQQTDVEDPAGWLATPTLQLFTWQHWDDPDEDPYWAVRLTGYASSAEVGGALPGEERPAVPVIRKRLDSVKDLLVKGACGDKPSPACKEEAEALIRTQVSLDEGQSVSVEVHPPRDFNTFSHEAGHMLGLGDESIADPQQDGQPIVAREYSALVVLLIGDEDFIRYHSGEGIMSRGGTVLPRHYVTFLEALSNLSDVYSWMPESPAVAAAPQPAVNAPKNVSISAIGAPQAAPPAPTQCPNTSLRAGNG